MTYRIGLIVGMENTFPPALIAKINERPGFLAELARIGGTPEKFRSHYHVLVDRLSHEVPFYRYHLKAASLSGTYVINNPFWWSADEKFFGYSLASRIGVTVPRTVMLPQHSYIPAIDPTRSLRNLEYPLDWQGIADYVGFPAILKPAEGAGWKNLARVHDLDELLAAYDRTGQSVMMLQQLIEFDQYVRCLCVGREFILPIEYDPRRRRYLEHDGRFLAPAVEQAVLDAAWALNQALGYDLNSVEFAIKDGAAYAIDFTDPAPDLDIHSILPKHFHLVVDEVARFAIEAAEEGRRNDDGLNFRRFLAAPTPRPDGELRPKGQGWSGVRLSA